MGKLLRWIVVAAVLFFAWKFVVPWVRHEAGSSGRSSAASTTGRGDSACVGDAERASSAWGSGLGRFVNPPYDLDAWSAFRGDVESKVSAAESNCSCSEESCRTVSTAMTELRGLVGEFDTAIRNGSAPPEGAVQRQERIDSLLTQAGDLARSGK